MSENLKNSALATGLELVNLHSNPKEGQCQRTFKLWYCGTALISHASKVIHKILQVRLQQYVNQELPDVQVGFRKGRATRDQVVHICWVMEKPREFKKNIYFCIIDYAKAFYCMDNNKSWKIIKEMGIPDHFTSWEYCMHIKKQHLEPDMGQRSGSKLGKKYCHTVCLTYMQNISCKMLGWMSYKLESRLQGDVSATSDMQMIPP